jgi:hypothetical protein
MLRLKSHEHRECHIPAFCSRLVNPILFYPAKDPHYLCVELKSNSDTVSERCDMLQFHASSSGLEGEGIQKF